MSGRDRGPRGRRVHGGALALTTLLGCFEQNPTYGGHASDTGPATGSESADAATTVATGTSGSAATGTVTGTGTAGETSSTATTAAAACGDALIGADEACDDGNDAADDGCVACQIPASDAELLALAPGSPSGTYLIDPSGAGEPWPAACDMDKDGGGWTGFTVQDTCNGHLMSAVVPLSKAEIDGIDPECRPFSEYTNGGEYGYYWDIAFPPTFSAFFLRDYQVQGLGDAELKHPQTLWDKPFEWPNGALSLGSAHDPGPVANWALDGGMVESFTDGQILPYPLLESPFELGQATDTLRIGWGEIGINPEGLYPWWAGQIFVR